MSQKTLADQLQPEINDLKRIIRELAEYKGIHAEAYIDGGRSLEIIVNALHSSDAAASEPEKCPECKGTGWISRGLAYRWRNLQKKEVILENLRQADSAAYGSHREGKPLSNSCSYTIRQAIQTAYNFVRDNYPAHPADGDSPAVPEEVRAEVQRVQRIRDDLRDFDGDKRGIAEALRDAEQKLVGLCLYHFAAAPNPTGEKDV